LYAFGTCKKGCLGLGEKRSTKGDEMIKVPLENIINIKAGKNHILALDLDGRLWGWGSNEFGQLGIGNEMNQFSPVDLTPFIDKGEYVSKFKPYEDSTFVITDSEEVYSCGKNEGFLGLKNDSDKVINWTRLDHGNFKIK
jgi:alpha-tubulin suppressor-like RCC1 family protein